MKYLKTLEDIFDVPPIKKYIIWKNPLTHSDGTLIDDKLFLCETEAYAMSDKIKISKIYTYKNNKIEKIKDPEAIYNYEYTDYSSFKKYILYQSDDLEDCLEQIITIEAENKYNL
jgi:predicted RecB family nuclease